MAAQGSLETELAHLPGDGITQSRFAHLSNSLLVSSWDKTVRLYNAAANQQIFVYEHEGAVLDCCFNADDTAGFSGGVDCKLRMVDFKTGKETVLGSHKAAIKCVLHNGPSGLILSGSWDKSVSLWDSRAHNPQVGMYDMPGKVYSMHQVENRVVVGTSGRHVHIYDIRKMHKPEQIRESSLMHQTRCIRCFPNGKGYALSSIEGRVSIEYFDPSKSAQDKKYAFKCHRVVKQGVQTLFPVNAIAFHPVHGTFATGGCDGMINVWDGGNKKRICQYPAYPTSIAALDFNFDGSLLAIAASYTFENGEKDHPKDTIFIRSVNDPEVRPKQRKN